MTAFHLHTRDALRCKHFADEPQCAPRVRTDLDLPAIQWKRLRPASSANPCSAECTHSIQPFRSQKSRLLHHASQSGPCPIPERPFRGVLSDCPMPAEYRVWRYKRRSVWVLCCRMIRLKCYFQDGQMLSTSRYLRRRTPGCSQEGGACRDELLQVFGIYDVLLE